MKQLQHLALALLALSACIDPDDTGGDVDLGEASSELGINTRVAWGLGTYGPPTLFRGFDNRLQLVGTLPNNTVVYDVETTAGSWAAPYPTLIGGSALVSNKFTAVQQQDGKTVVFAVSSGFLYRSQQTVAYGRTWTTWYPVGPAQNRQPSFARNQDGRLEGVYLGSDGKVRQLWQQSVNGAWSAPYDTGVTSYGTPEIARDPWDRLEIFAPVAGGTCGFRSWRQIDPNGWNGWYAPTVNGNLCVDNLAVTYSGYYADVFEQTTDGGIYLTTRGAPALPFGAQVLKYSSSNGSLGTIAAPTMTTRPGDDSVYAFTGHDGFYRWMKRSGTAWYGFAILASSVVTTPPPLAVAEDWRSRMVGFVVNSAGTGLDKVFLQ